MTRNTQDIFRIDFSLRREIFFVVIGAIIGAITMYVPITFLYTGLGLPYYLTWMAFGHVIGVYSSPSSSIIAGIAIHLITAISIGIAVGVFLYKTGILNIRSYQMDFYTDFWLAQLFSLFSLYLFTNLFWPLRLLARWLR